jgi:hypothetical protein
MTQLTTPAPTAVPVPDWVKEDLPAWLTPHMGRPGLGSPWTNKQGPMGGKVAGLDFWHANHFIVYKPETKDFLDNHYTPLHVDYKPGSHPQIEKAVAHLKGRPKDIALGVELLEKVLPTLAKHPTVAPCGPYAAANRALDDEALITSGTAWCNEQSRLFVRLCQAVGIPARMIFLCFINGANGHVTSEFYAQGRWIQADPSWFCVYPGPDGLPLTTPQCHTPEGNKIVSRVLQAKIDALSKMSDEYLGMHHQPKARQTLQEWRTDLDKQNLLDRYGVVNYPLPK